MGRFVDKRLEEMGAKRVFEKGEGDDDGKWVAISPQQVWIYLSFKDKKTSPYFPILGCGLRKNYEEHKGSLVWNPGCPALELTVYERSKFSQSPKGKS